MKYIWTLALVALVSCRSNGQQSSQVPPLPTPVAEPLTSADSSNVRKSVGFAFRLMRELQPADGKVENRVVSPLSVGYALGMLAEGAKGPTLAEVERVLGMSRADAASLYRKLANNLLLKDTAVAVLTSNMVAVNQRYQLLPGYRDALLQNYRADVASLDFGARESADRINRWCNERTRGMVPGIVDGLDEQQAALLLNAIYFKGTWHTEFDEARNGLFTNADGHTVSLPTMRTEAYFAYLKRDGYALLRMDYYWQRLFGMVIVLPDRGRTTADVLASMTAEQWAADMQAMRRDVKVNVSLPRFETENELELTSVLARMGLVIAFTGQADFSGMVSTGVRVGKVVQRAKVKVNEKGTEAAAVTKVEMLASLAVREPEPVVLFHATRPFLYAIVDYETSLPLFLGEYRGDTSAQRVDVVADDMEETPQGEGEAQPAEAPLPGSDFYCCDLVEEMPSFPGGDKALMEFIRETVRYPEEAAETCVQGRVIVKFIVEKDGSLSNIKIVKSVDPLFDREAIRVVKAMPRWTPGRQNGQPMRVSYVIPVTFKLK